MFCALIVCPNGNYIQEESVVPGTNDMVPEGVREPFPVVEIHRSYYRVCIQPALKRCRQDSVTLVEHEAAVQSMHRP